MILSFSDRPFESGQVRPDQTLRGSTSSPDPAAKPIRSRSARKCLFPQSGGFEGVSVVVDGCQFGHLVPRKCEKPSHRLVELHAAGAAPEADRSKRQKPLFRRIPELVDGGVPTVELIIDLCHPAPHAVVAVIRGIRHLRMDYDVVVDKLGVNLPLSGVPAVELPADQLLAASDHSRASIPPRWSLQSGDRQPSAKSAASAKRKARNRRFASSRASGAAHG